MSDNLPLRECFVCSQPHWVNGRIAEKNKDTATAEREYRTAIDESHGGANAWLNLALFYRKAGRFDEMQDALKQGFSVADTPLFAGVVVVVVAATAVAAYLPARRALSIPPSVAMRG